MVDLERLKTDIKQIAAYGEEDGPEGYGRTSITGTDVDRQVREYFVDRMLEFDLEVTVDQVGNISGQWVPSGVDPETQSIATGSHLDSVPNGGIFDGVLGVCAGLEAVRSLRESDANIQQPIEVVSFTEEEGHRFPTGLLGSSVSAGERSPEEALAMQDQDGTTLEAALSDIGFHGDGLIDANEWDSWIELHIEQDTVLEDKNASIGIVSNITGISKCHVELVGETDHAGTTSMNERFDALAGASEFILDVEKAANEVALTNSETAVGTVGYLENQPNVSSAIPGKVTLEVDIRDIDHGAMDAIARRASRSLAMIEQKRNLETIFDRFRDQPPTKMDPRIRSAAKDAARSNDIEFEELPSGATHDTVKIASVTDSSLLFAPSVGGYSHSPKEWTEWRDCERSTIVLRDTIRRLAGTQK